MRNVAILLGNMHGEGNAEPLSQLVRDPDGHATMLESR